MTLLYSATKNRKMRRQWVTPQARQAADPYPQHREDDKFLVWGLTPGGRLVQVVFLLDKDDTVFVNHARPLTEREKRRRRRRESRRRDATRKLSPPGSRS